uniref:LITAF domain-containing protein n=1 Tax=Panagrolaimus sp. PS1159 TaxID=55785 RepID=A0AC35FKF5_9BILA
MSNNEKLIPEREASAPPPPYEFEATGNSSSSNPAELKYTPEFKAPPPPPPYETKPTITPSSTRQIVYVPSNQTFESEPVIMNCPYCQKLIETKIEHKVGLLSWLGCLGCVLLDCTAGCCLIPFCIDSCKDCEHYCPSCKSFLGKYKRLG